VGEAFVQTLVKATRRPTTTPPTGFPGFQRVTGQRIVLTDHEPECTVYGRLHRRTVEQRVPLSVAVDLARRGVHTVVRVAED